MTNAAASHLLPVFARVDLGFTSGEGAWLVATNGDRYLDFTSGVAVNALGHAHPHLVAAISEQATKLWHVSNLYRIPEAERLAARLCQSSFADVVFFANSGAEAMECAIKMARKYHSAGGAPERYRIVTFEGAFHGRTLGSLAVTHRKKARLGFPTFDWPHASFPAEEPRSPKETARREERSLRQIWELLVSGRLPGADNAAQTCDLQKALDQLLSIPDSQPVKFLKQEVDDAAGKLAVLNACRPTATTACFFPGGPDGDKLKKRLSDGITLRRADLQAFLKAVIAVKRPDCRVCDLYDRWELVREVYGDDLSYWHPDALAKIDGSRVQMAKAMKTALAAIGGSPSDPNLLRAKRSLDAFIDADVGTQSQAYWEAWLNPIYWTPEAKAVAREFNADLRDVAKNPSVCDLK
jgi:hypothetical protein